MIDNWILIYYNIILAAYICSVVCIVTGKEYWDEAFDKCERRWRSSCFIQSLNVNYFCILTAQLIESTYDKGIHSVFILLGRTLKRENHPPPIGEIFKRCLMITCRSDQKAVSFLWLTHNVSSVSSWTFTFGNGTFYSFIKATHMFSICFQWTFPETTCVLLTDTLHRWTQQIGVWKVTVLQLSCAFEKEAKGGSCFCIYSMCVQRIVGSVKQLWSLQLLEFFICLLLSHAKCAGYRGGGRRELIMLSWIRSFAICFDTPCWWPLWQMDPSLQQGRTVRNALAGHVESN